LGTQVHCRLDVLGEVLIRHRSKHRQLHTCNSFSYRSHSFYLCQHIVQMSIRLISTFAILVGLCSAFTFTVTVGIDETNGQPGLGFDPSVITPAAGDTIAFTFQLPSYIKNPTPTEHSATQSLFDNPCSPIPGGFDTGIQSTGSENTQTGSTFNLVVNDTQPLWFFSSANSDCKSGMVLAVNPPTSGDQTAAAFKQKAMSSRGTPSPTTAASSSPTTASGSSSPSPSSSTSPPSTGGTISPQAKLELVFAGIVALLGLLIVV